jgi:mannose-6-phosphate isomerase-like protein (cupin superfamily)
MSAKSNAFDPSLPWQSAAYYIAARHRELAGATLLQTPQVRYIEVEAGGRILPHAHGQPELYFCIDGHGVFTRNKESVPLEAGDYLLVPPGCIQGLDNTGKHPLRLLAIMLHHEQMGVAGRLHSLITTAVESLTTTDHRPPHKP